MTAPAPVHPLPPAERSIYWTDTADSEHARCLACDRPEYRRRDGRTYLYLYDGIGPVCSPRCAHKLTERPAESPVHPLPPALFAARTPTRGGGVKEHAVMPDECISLCGRRVGQSRIPWRGRIAVGSGACRRCDELATFRQDASLAATTPPPVRVVRLAGSPVALEAAADALTSGGRAIEAATNGNEGAAGSWAYTAARHARLALGASREQQQRT